MSARLLVDTSRAESVRMNDRDQLARRLGCWIIKNKPATATAPDALKPKRPTNARDRAVPPPPAGDSRQSARHYRQTTRPAPMAQRIKPDTRQPINPRRAHRVTHNMMTNPTAQYINPVTTPPTRDEPEPKPRHPTDPPTVRDSSRRAIKTSHRAPRHLANKHGTTDTRPRPIHHAEPTTADRPRPQHETTHRQNPAPTCPTPDTQ